MAKYITKDYTKPIVGYSEDKISELDELRNELLDVIDERFAKIKDEMNEMYNNLVQITNKRTVDSIKFYKENFEKATKDLQEVKNTVEERFEKANKNLENASRIINLDDHDINISAIKELFVVANNNNKWIENNSSDVETIRRDYKNLSKKLTDKENEEGTFTNILYKINDMKKNVSTITEKNEELSNKITRIEKEEIKDGVVSK